MHRREWFKVGALAGAAAGVSWLAHTPLAQEPKVKPEVDEKAAGASTSGLRRDARQDADRRAAAAKLKITDIRTILTAPAGIRLVVVKVLTNEPGLHGLGCATFTQRARAVETAVDQYLKPFLIGKDPLRMSVSWNARRENEDPRRRSSLARSSSRSVLPSRYHSG